MARRLRYKRVYFIYSEKLNAVKIGVSSNPKQRLYDLKTANPDNLKILGIMYTPSGQLETSLHTRFAHLRIDREWFQYSEELRLFIEQNTTHNYDALIEECEPAKGFAYFYNAWLLKIEEKDSRQLRERAENYWNAHKYKIYQATGYIPIDRQKRKPYESSDLKKARSMSHYAKKYGVSSFVFDKWIKQVIEVGKCSFCGQPLNRITACCDYQRDCAVSCRGCIRKFYGGKRQLELTTSD